MKPETKKKTLYYIKKKTFKSARQKTKNITLIKWIIETFF